METTFNLVLPKDLKLRFQKRMLDEGKSMAAVIRFLMTDYLENTKEAA